jgi:hypothetical protein
MKGRARWGVLAAVAMLLTGCGAATGMSAKATAPVVEPPTLRTLRVVEWHTAAPPGFGGQASLTVNLTGAGLDKVAVTVNQTGVGQVTVTGPGLGQWTAPHVGAVTALDFGPAHLPVLLLQGDVFDCGSGGCAYWAYTWDAHRRRLVPVLPPTTEAYRFDPTAGTFHPVNVAGSDLFGYVRPSHRGIWLTVRLYDVWQHVESLPFAYAPAGSPGGVWVADGAPRYAPEGPEPLSGDSPEVVAEALIEARALGLGRQAEPLVRRDAWTTVWAALASLQAWGASLSEVGTPTVKSAGPSAWVVEWTVSGTTPTTFGADRLAIHVRRQAAGYEVTAAVLRPLNLRVTSALAALQRLRATARGRAWLAQVGRGLLQVTPDGLNWNVTPLQSGSAAGWATVSAATGSVQVRHV